MSASNSDLAPLPRCCPTHSDWPTLAEHLVRDFPQVASADVLRELTRSKDAVSAFGLDEVDQFGVAELMTRHQMLLLTGEVADAARLDPEHHQRTTSAP